MTGAGNEADLLHVWLINGGEDGRRFFDDICQMLVRLAGRSGGSLVPASATPSVVEASCDFRARVVGGGSLSRLRQEVGVHRAQCVPEGSSTGRVETSLVGVEVIPTGATASSGRPEGSVMKTYSYVQGWVLHHPSGRRLGLAAVLAGEA
jgi:protein subunit release factor A